MRSAMAMAVSAIIFCGGVPLFAEDIPSATVAVEVQKQLDAELAAWFPRCVDRERGGFHQTFDNQWRPTASTRRGAVFQSRMVWVTATMARAFPQHADAYRGYAAHGLATINNLLVDREHGGVFWDRNADDTPTSFGDEKNVYGLAFVIYAAAAAHETLPDSNALELARQTFAWLEEHAHDARHGGYIEALARDGTPMLDGSKSPRPDAKLDCLGTPYGYKSMNAHLHLLEAFTELYRRWPDPLLKRRLAEIHQLMLSRMFVEPGAIHLHYTRDWRAVPGHASYGHDVEAAYLLLESAAALGMAKDPATLKAARQLVDHALEFGWDAENGGMCFEGQAFKPADLRTKNWWTQAESLNALLIMHQLFGSETPLYGQRFVEQWRYIRDRQIDPVHGGWFPTLDPPGQPIATEKGHGWKACYHNTRAMLNVVNRLKSLPQALQTLPQPPIVTTRPASTQPSSMLSIDIQPGPNPWTHLNIRNGGRDFQFAVVSDNAGGRRPGVFAKAVRSLNLLQPQFVMSVGDFINGYKPTSEINGMWDEFLADLKPLQPPFFMVPGNHDIGSKVMRPIWHERFGRAYYHFVYQDVLFLCLNSNDRNPYKGFAPEQVEYIRKTLQDNTDVRWTFVFLHRPIWTEKDGEGWPAVEAMLAGRKHTVFCGHTHQYLKEQRNGGEYYTLSVTGGANLLRGPVYGDFDHVAWVTFTDTGPKVANIDINAVRENDVRTRATRSIAWHVDRAAVFQPLRIDSDTFTTGRAVLRLRNGSELPARISGTIKPHPTLDVSPRTVDVRLDPAKPLVPAEVRPLEIQLRSDRPIHIDDLAPLLFTGTVTYDVPGAKPLSIPIQTQLRVDRFLPAAQVSTPVAVDGVLGEWSSLPVDLRRPRWLGGAGASWGGAEDASARFGVHADAQFLYFASEIKDDIHLVGGKGGDGLEVWLDARPEGQRNGGPGNLKALTAGTLRLLLRPENGGGELPAGAHAAVRRSETGYTVELAVPVAYLDKMHKSAWKSVRVNVCLYDSDAQGDRPAELWWRPDWRGQDLCPASGTFQKPR